MYVLGHWDKIVGKQLRRSQRADYDHQLLMIVTIGDR